MIDRIKENKNLLIVLVLIFVIILLLVGRFTYAFFAPDLDVENIVESEITATGDTITFSKGSDLSFLATTDNFGTGAGNLSATTTSSAKLVSSSKTKNASALYQVSFLIKENTYLYTTEGKTAELILTITDPEGNEMKSISGLNYVTVGEVSGFDVTEVTGVYNIANNYEITTSSTSGTTQTWSFTLTFINLETDQSLNENSNFDSNVILSRESSNLNEICNTGDNLASCIVLLEEKSYYDTTGLVKHDSNLKYTANDNSIRYSGANPNNFVCLANDCVNNTLSLYRIIGVYEDKIKLIKYEPLIGQDFDYLGLSNSRSESINDTYKGQMDDLGTVQWNNSSSNVWNTSTLYTDLQKYYDNTFTNTNYAGMIIENEWIMANGTRDNLLYNNADKIYSYELGDYSVDSTFNAKYGLMYISEYAYAASPDYWAKSMLDETTSDYRSAINDNWMHMGIDEWTMTSHVDDSAGEDYITDVFALISGGFIGSDVDSGDGSGAFSYNAIRPTFYFDGSLVKYISGTGSITDPLIIS